MARLLVFLILVSLLLIPNVLLARTEGTEAARDPEALLPVSPSLSARSRVVSGQVDRPVAAEETRATISVPTVTPKVVETQRDTTGPAVSTLTQTQLDARVDDAARLEEVFKGPVLEAARLAIFPVEPIEKARDSAAQLDRFQDELRVGQIQEGVRDDQFLKRSGDIA